MRRPAEPRPIRQIRLCIHPSGEPFDLFDRIRDVVEPLRLSSRPPTSSRLRTPSPPRVPPRGARGPEARTFDDIGPPTQQVLRHLLDADPGRAGRSRLSGSMSTAMSMSLPAVRIAASDGAKEIEMAHTLRRKSSAWVAQCDQRLGQSQAATCPPPAKRSSIASRTSSAGWSASWRCDCLQPAAQRDRHPHRQESVLDSLCTSNVRTAWNDQPARPAMGNARVRSGAGS